MSFVQVSESNCSDTEIIEMPLEEDGTLLLYALLAQYPNACGLQYVAPDNGRTRVIRLTEDNKLHPPTGDGWGDIIYFCSFKKGRKLCTQINDTEFNLPKETQCTSADDCQKLRLDFEKFKKETLMFGLMVNLMHIGEAASELLESNHNETIRCTTEIDIDNIPSKKRRIEAERYN